MAKRNLPGLGLTGYWPLGSNNWGPENDINLRLLSALVQSRVLSRTVSLPGAPGDGSIYIAPTGDPNVNKIAIRDEGVWVYLTPEEGYLCYVADEDIFVRFTGTSWSQCAMFYDPGIFISGKPLDSELVFRWQAVRPFALPAALAGSYGSAAVASTGTIVFSIRKNGTQFATLTFTTSATGVFSGSAVDFAVGDILSIIAPPAADVSLSDININLRGRLL